MRGVHVVECGRVQWHVARPRRQESQREEERQRGEHGIRCERGVRTAAGGEHVARSVRVCVRRVGRTRIQRTSDIGNEFHYFLEPNGPLCHSTSFRMTYAFT